MTNIIPSLKVGLLVVSLLASGAMLLPAASAAPNVPNTPCPTSTNPWAGWQWPGYGQAFYCPATGLWCQNLGHGVDRCWGIKVPVDVIDLASVDLAYPVDPRATYEAAAKALPALP